MYIPNKRETYDVLIYMLRESTTAYISTFVSCNEEYIICVISSSNIPKAFDFHDNPSKLVICPIEGYYDYIAMLLELLWLSSRIWQLVYIPRSFICLFHEFY